MTVTNMRLDRGFCWLGIAVCCLLTACGTPPSVMPLLQVADRALQEEAAMQAQDLARDLAHVHGTRTALATAFEKDLVQTPELTAQWVRDAVEIYAAAREALMQHEQALRQMREQRKDNLHAAGEAVRRAMWVLQQQDDTIDRTFGGRAWDFVQPIHHSFTETPQ